jgi:hypothetical protein
MIALRRASEPRPTGWVPPATARLLAKTTVVLGCNSDHDLPANVAARTELMKTLAYITFGWLFTVVVSWFVGKLLLRRLSLRLYKQEEDILGFVVGSACLSTVIFLLCSLHVAYKAVFLTVGLLVISAGVRQRVWESGAERLPRLPAIWRLLFCGIYLVFAGLYLVYAFAPESSPDGSTYHLGLVIRYLHEHGFPAITNNFYASLPQGMEMLFLYAYVWGRHSAAALVHCTFLLALPCLILNYGRRLGMPGAGVAGGLLIFLAPVAGIAGTSAYNDVALAAVSFSMFALLEVWFEQRDNRMLIAAGLLAGFAFAIKYTAFIAPVYATGFVSYAVWRSHKRTLRPLLVVTISAAVLIIPTLVKNWVIVRNPVSPFFNRVFPNPYIHVSFEQDVLARMRAYDSIHSVWQIPYEVTLSGAALQGILGPLFLLAPLSLLALRFPAGRRLLVAALIFLAPYPANLGTRFLLPAAMFIAPGIGIGLNAWSGIIPPILMMHALLSWPSNIHWYSDINCWRLGQTPIRAALRIESEDEYLRKRMGAEYEMARLMERLTPPGSHIFSLGVPIMAYCARDILPSFYSAFNLRLLYTLCAGFDLRLQPLRVVTFRFEPQRLRGVRLLEGKATKPTVPSIHELRIFGPASELQPEAAWHLNAHPFPWDVALAFDRNPATRWSAWQQVDAGSWIEAHFQRDEILSAVSLETSRDQESIPWTLEGKTAADHWVSLHVNPDVTSAPPVADIRRSAIQELKRNHIEYLLIDSDFAIPEFRDHAPQWGVRLLSELDGSRWFYRLE